MKHPLSEKLRLLANSLDGNILLTGETDLFKLIEKLTPQVDKVYTLLENRSVGRSPEAAIVLELLKEIYPDKSQEKEFKSFLKQFLPKAPTFKKDYTYNKYLNVVVEALGEAHVFPRVRQYLDRQKNAPTLDFSSKDRDSLLVQIRKLGAMDDLGRKKAVAKLMTQPKTTELLAEAAGLLKPGKEIPPTKSLINKLLKLGATFHENRGV